MEILESLYSYNSLRPKLIEPKGQLLSIDGKTEEEVCRSLERVLRTMRITTLEPKDVAFVVDGWALEIALTHYPKAFTKLAVLSRTAICCRALISAITNTKTYEEDTCVDKSNPQHESFIKRYSIKLASTSAIRGHHHLPETRGLCLSEEQTVPTPRDVDDDLDGDDRKSERETVTANVPLVVTGARERDGERKDRDKDRKRRDKDKDRRDRDRDRERERREKDME
ncbi:hypothetical protein JHK87_042645 [Glycine soja]|nr:hypothetical protein JHK87_042645 [Glycine soja]